MMTSRSPCLSASPRRISKFTAAALFALTTATCRQMCLSFVVALCAGGMAPAQTNAKVTVNLAKELNILTKLAVHATKRRDGFTAIMLINKDPQNAITAKVSIAGGPVGAKGKRFDYGITQQKVGLPTVPSEIKDLGAEFTMTVPPYSITDVLIEN